MAIYNGLIIPRTYNDYFQRSAPQEIINVLKNGGFIDAELNTESENPIQNKAIAQLIPAGAAQLADKAQVDNNGAAIAAIENKIPATASAQNQLADKDFVNSTVGTNTAIFRGTFNSLAELEAYTGEKTNNDYAFVVAIDAAGNTVYNRYKYNGSTWVYEYPLNNSSFTAEQWASIQSGITSTLVQSLISIIGNTSIYARTNCESASDAENKEIEIEDFSADAGVLIGITFTNGNTYGDCMAEPATYPTLSINGGDSYPICDSRGNTVGAGAWNDGDYIELRYIGNKYIITNSEVRQVVDDEYILLADGSKKSIDYYENGSYTIENESIASGYISSSGKSLFLGIVLEKRVPKGKTITLTGIKANLRSNSTQYSSGTITVKISGGYIGTSADSQTVSGGFNFYNAANDGRSITPSQGNMYLVRLARTSAWYNGHWNDMNNYTVAGSVMSISFTISDSD